MNQAILYGVTVFNGPLHVASGATTKGIIPWFVDKSKEGNALWVCMHVS